MQYVSVTSCVCGCACGCGWVVCCWEILVTLQLLNSDKQCDL
jgi:hypothetical protein